MNNSKPIKLATTTELAALVQVHPFTVSKLFGPARFGRRYNGVVYELHHVAKIISEASGHEITAADLPKLIKRQQAMSLLTDAGAGRSLRTWCYWADDGIGPRVLKVGERVYHLTPEVLDWAYQLRHCRRGCRPCVA